MGTWWALQAVVLAAWAVSEWAVRYAPAGANRVLRGWLVGALVLLWLPVPWPWSAVEPLDEVVRLVPLQSEAVAVGLPAVVDPAGPVSHGVGWVALALGGAVVGLCGVQLLRWRRRIGSARVLHRYGRVTVAVADVGSPCVVWWGRPWILLDAATAADRGARDLAVRHEARHIRHGDLFFAWAVLGLVALCAPNPAVWRLARNLAELDEHAVDHALVHTRAVSPRRYGQLLLAAATGPTALVAAPGLAHTTPLHRRLHMLALPRPARPLGWALAGLLLVATAAVAAPRPSAAYVSDGLTAPEHPLVDRAYERLTVDPRGERFLRGALARRPAHRDHIADRLAEAGLPRALEAVVLVESGYNDQLETGDLESAAPPGPVGAGLWMFIPSTARTYGLRVDAEVDERLDRELETDAAVALLSDLHGEFGDWGLALAGYNQGAAHVRRAIAEHGSRDALVLAEKGALNRYVPMVYAAMRVLEER